jgi:3-keto-disaccharide hydrolase
LNIVSTTGDTVTHAKLVAALASGLTLALTAVTAPRMALAQAATGSATERLNILTPEERAAGWRLLFDGHSTIGWRGWKMDTMPSGWGVREGALTRAHPAADIITTEKFKNFELTLEWNISPGGNSGIFYRASEDPDDNAIYWSAPEYQVLDDAGHPDGQSRLTAAGSDYGLYPSPAGVVKPAGQWNTTRLVVNGNHVEHWLNGVKVVEYELGSPDWEKRVKESKFATHPRYGRNTEGYIGLQEHEFRVAYRNVKIRVLP